MLDNDVKVLIYYNNKYRKSRIWFLDVILDIAGNKAFDMSRSSSLHIRLRCSLISSISAGLLETPRPVYRKSWGSWIGVRVDWTKQNVFTTNPFVQDIVSQTP